MVEGKKRSSLPAHVRAQVIHEAAERAAHEGKALGCPLCKFVFSLGESDPNIEVDHKMPVSEGGTNELENLEPLCRSCNRSKNYYEEANPEREAVARKVLCVCSKAFYLDDKAYATCLALIRLGLLPCPECRALITPKPPPPKRRGRLAPGAGLPEGFGPAKAMFKREGVK